MKICAVQTRPLKGDFQGNIGNHLKLIDLALLYDASIIIFPELSLTGYEPELAKDLAIDLYDSRLDCFQKISNSRLVILGVGAPLKNHGGICIGMVLFQPNKPGQAYTKKYLHPDEKEFFISGQGSAAITGQGAGIALAICYELSVPEHSENAFKNGASIYIASAVKSVNGIDKACKSLSEIANRYSMVVLLANCVGQSGGYECAGKTSAWNNEGVLTGQLDDSSEGILIIDTVTGKIIKRQI